MIESVYAKMERSFCYDPGPTQALTRSLSMLIGLASEASRGGHHKNHRDHGCLAPPQEPNAKDSGACGAALAAWTP